ncbi:MAG TPA: ABC transporter permease [Armatimonadota bacterium]|nr:ABC transporter permease [Armatimonadota bacterium]
MRALFLKELNQGRPLLVFALVLALLIPIGYAVVSRALFRLDPGYGPGPVQFFFGLAVIFSPLIIALVASSGIFSSEVAAGTTPILFALPLSRRRIWAAMVLAALALTAAGTILLIGLDRLLLPSAFRLLPLRAYLPDIICFTLFYLSVGIFCSSLTRSVTAALAVSILLAAALTFGATWIVLSFGAFILGLPTLDVALWCLLASPALLLSSLLPITRGELLTAPRKWHALAVWTATIGVAVTVFLVCGIVRLATRYDRSRVTSVSEASLQDDGRVLSLLSHSKDVSFSTRRLEVRQHLRHLSPLHTDRERSEDIPETLPVPLANYWVALDLDTGEELSTERIPMPYLGIYAGEFEQGFGAALSPDGSRRAVYSDAPGFTWGRGETHGLQLRILDTKDNPEIYRGIPDSLQWRSFYDISWSPTGRYFALTRDGTFHVFNADGSQPGEHPVPIRLDSTTWSPVEDVILGLDRSGALVRAYPDGRKTETIWAPPPDPTVAQRSFSPHYISPDGRWLILTEMISKTAEDEAGRSYEQRLEAALLVNTVDGRSQEIWRAPDEWPVLRDLRWLPDGTVVALLRVKWDPTTQLVSFRLLRMRPGEDRLSPVGWEIEATSVRLFVGSTPDEAFVHAQSWDYPDEQDHMGPPVPPTLEREELTAVSMDGSTRKLELPPDPGALPYSERIVGFDHRGRLIVLGASQQDLRSYPAFDSVDALDVATGQVTAIYP